MKQKLKWNYIFPHRIVGHKDALQVAKQVVSQDYSVVGLVEHMEVSLLLMEALVPRFMVGASQVYSSRSEYSQGTIWYLGLFIHSLHKEKV